MLFDLKYSYVFVVVSPRRSTPQCNIWRPLVVPFSYLVIAYMALYEANHKGRAIDNDPNLPFFEPSVLTEGYSNE